MSNVSDQRSRGHGGVALLVAILIGLMGALFIWTATPYNNFLIGSGFISDSYLPVAALFFFLLLVGAVNPLLRFFTPGSALGRGQLAVILGMLLVASVLPGQGLMRVLPYSLAQVPLETSRDQRLARLYEETGISPRLFPDSLEFGADTPVSERLITELGPDDSIPWSAWLDPLWTWGLLLLALWVMMMGLALVVLPQWRNNERLAFPIVTVGQSLIEPPEEGRLLPPLLRTRSFWVSAMAVLGVYLLMGYNQYHEESVPAIPLEWNLGGLFTGDLLRHLPGHIHSNRIYFIFLGMAFFMPGRIGFSIWFFVFAYALYLMFGRAYVPAFDGTVVRDHRWGAMVVLTVAILWLGRAHWVHVGRCMFKGGGPDTDRRDRMAGWMLVLGAAGMFLWLATLGNVQPWWALFYVGFAFSATLLVTRIIAETGIPFFRIDTGYQVPLVKLIGAHLSDAKMLWMLSPASLYFSTVMSILIEIASRISPAVMMTHALATDDQAPPRRQRRMAVVLLLMLLIGVVVCGGVHLYISYNHSGTLDGREQPISSWGTGWLGVGAGDLQRLDEGRFNNPRIHDTSRLDLGFGHIAIGAVMAGGLYWLCLRSPAWPLHPIGILIANTWYGNGAWVSIFLGWLIKVLLLKYGGARAYRSARPVFLGLILGEVIAAAYWALEPAVRIWRGLPYETVNVLPH